MNGFFVTNRGGFLMVQSAVLEYIFTIGILISFLAVVIGAVMDRKQHSKGAQGHGFAKHDLIIVIGIVLVFVFIELYFVKPTQLLFFDDAIYQAMAVNLIHTGQAWMCNYGTPTTCFSGQVFHEPIGLSFNIAIAFLLFGVNRTVGIRAPSSCWARWRVFMSFFVSLLFLKDKRAAFFTALMMALSPIILVWAMPTNSDLAALAYSLISIFFLFVFMRKKSIWSLSNMLFSFSLLLYMKVNELFFAPIFIVVFLLESDKSIVKAAKGAWKEIRNNVLNTKVLIIVLLVVLAIMPSILYAFNESLTDGYGWQGTLIQNTCVRTPGAPNNVTGEINLMNFKHNVCGNVAFWFNQYRSQYVMQPIFFTALAILGALLMLVVGGKRHTLLALGFWFIAFFLLYCAFYAGSVVYGVDWRFMLSLVAEASIFGGFAIATVIGFVESSAKRFTKNTKLVGRIATVAFVIALFVPIYMLLPLLSVSPAQIDQAGDARFYEGFVYNNTNQIPSNCLVYSYDPTLFIINNRTSAQIGQLFNYSQVSQFRQQYNCLILDYGYWCHTPNNQCTLAKEHYTLVPIATATYKQFNYDYGFYKIT